MECGRCLTWRTVGIGRPCAAGCKPDEPAPQPDPANYNLGRLQSTASPRDWVQPGAWAQGFDPSIVVKITGLHARPPGHNVRVSYAVYDAKGQIESEQGLDVDAFVSRFSPIFEPSFIKASPPQQAQPIQGYSPGSSVVRINPLESKERTDWLIKDLCRLVMDDGQSREIRWPLSIECKVTVLSSGTTYQWFDQRVIVAEHVRQKGLGYLAMTVRPDGVIEITRDAASAALMSRNLPLQIHSKVEDKFSAASAKFHASLEKLRESIRCFRAQQEKS